MSSFPLEISALHTFGSPRVFSPEAAAHVRETLLPGRIFRHAREGDLVTAIPRRKLPLPNGGVREVYAHVGNVAWIDGDGEIEFGTEAWHAALPSLNALRDDLARGRAAPESIERHRLAPYQTAVSRRFHRDAEPRDDGWNPAVALACARALRILHEGADEAAFGMLGFEHARPVKARGEIRALVAVPVTPPGQAYGVVAFRAQDLASLPEDEDWRRTLGEWATGLEVDLDAWHPDAPGRTHGRWLREVTRLERSVSKVIAKVCAGLPLVATGHGKGAGLATLWAARRAQDARARRASGEEPARAAPAPRRPAAEAPGRERWPWARRAVTPGRERVKSISLSHEEIGARIRRLREDQGLTQAELAALVGYEQSNISRIENGEYRIHLETLFTLLAQLDTTLAELFELPREEEFPPSVVRMLEDYRELSEDDRQAVDHLLRFKVAEKRETEAAEAGDGGNAARRPGE